MRKTAVVLTLTLVLSLPATAAPNPLGDVPNLDIGPSCRAAAHDVGPGQENLTYDGCLQSEQRARSDLEQEWPQFTAADRRNCAATVSGFEPTYSELVTCLEMSRDLRNSPSSAHAASNSLSNRGRSAIHGSL